MRLYVESQEDFAALRGPGLLDFPLLPLFGKVSKELREFVSSGKSISLSKEDI